MNNLVSSIETGIFNLPPNIPCSKREIKEYGLYLIDIGYLLILYITKKLNKNILQKLLGINEINLYNINYNEENVFETKNDLKERIMNIINYLRERKSNFQNLMFAFEGTDGEKFLIGYMIEDNYCKWFPLTYEKFYKKYIEDSLNVLSYGY